MRFGGLFGVLVTAIFALGIYAHQASAEQKTDAQYWADTQLVLSGLLNKGIIDNETCMKDLDHYRACYYALNDLAQSSTPSALLVPASVHAEPKLAYGKVLRELSAQFVLVERPRLPDGIAALKASVELARLRRPATEAALNGMYQVAKALNTSVPIGASVDLTSPAEFNSPTDFTAMGKDLIASGAFKPEEESMITASVYDTYIQIFDPHAHINPKAQLDDWYNGADRKVIGIGADLIIRDDVVVIKNVLPDSPASHAKIKRNDILQKVDGRILKGMDLNKVIEFIHGPEGSIVTLGIQRGKKAFKFKLKREELKNPPAPVTVEKLMGENYLYVRLGNFMNLSACNQMEDDIRKQQKIAKNKLRGLVLDLRDNPGGRVDQAICIGGLFVGNRQIVTVQSLDTGIMQESELPDKNQVTKLPMAILINAGSASASEIVAGALQYYERAWIVGDTSYGKGSVQQSDTKPGSPITEFRTIQRFYQPSGFTNQGVGIVPDFPVLIKPDASPEDQFAMRELDLSPNALPPEGGRFVSQRPQDIARIKKCREQKKAEAAYAAVDQQTVFDYQLNTAAEILQCDQ